MTAPPDLEDPRPHRPERVRGAAARARDADLIARAANGDDAAFAEVYEEHRRPLYRLAYGILLDRDEAHEVVQEAFVRLHRAAATWEPRAAVSTWLYRVVLREGLSVKRRLVRLVRAAPPRATRPAESPEGEASLRQAAVLVAEGLARLPARQRAVACLHLDAELSPAEIAPLVDLTPNATRVALHRALTRLREELLAAGIDSALRDADPIDATDHTTEDP
jgi:RNA polymerase sigma-70 factor (ECF subfamily)